MKKKSPTLAALAAGLDQSLKKNTTAVTLPPPPPVAEEVLPVPAGPAAPSAAASVDRTSLRPAKPRAKRAGAHYSERPTCYFPTDLEKVQQLQLYLAKHGRVANFSQAVRILVRRAEVDEACLRIDGEIRSEDRRRTT